MLTNKEKKANDILKILEKLYPKTPIPLSHKDPYTLLVAVVLSAQCTDERVNKIYSDCYKFVFLENSESFKDIKPIKYEHEWSHALVSYDEFICFTHSKNSFFLISLARD